jgi:hypothetical protein
MSFQCACPAAFVSTRQHTPLTPACILTPRPTSRYPRTAPLVVAFLFIFYLRWQTILLKVTVRLFHIKNISQSAHPTSTSLYVSYWLRSDTKSVMNSRYFTHLHDYYDCLARSVLLRLLPGREFQTNPIANFALFCMSVPMF